MSLFVAVASRALSWLGNKALDRILSFFERQADRMTERAKIGAKVAIEEIRAEVASRRAARDIVIAEQGWWVTALIRPLFAYPTITYYSAVIADSIFHFSWDVAKLPDPVGTWAGWIIGGYFISRPVEKVVRSYLHQKGQS